MEIQQLGPDAIIQQTKDFFAYCDKESYTYVRIYNAKELMRALENPYYRDVLGQLQLLLEKIVQNNILYGEQRKLDFYNKGEVVEVVRNELLDQVLLFSGATSEKSIASLNMEKIYEEYKLFIKEQRKEEREVLGKGIKSDEIVIDPYEYIHNRH